MMGHCPNEFSFDTSQEAAYTDSNKRGYCSTVIKFDGAFNLSMMRCRFWKIINEFIYRELRPQGYDGAVLGRVHYLHAMLRQ